MTRFDAALVERVRAWTFDVALPLWADIGVDRTRGGFVETVDFEGRDGAAAFKRVRVACRQIYVFSHASCLGFAEGAALATRGFDDLAAAAWLGPDRGWARTLTRDGQVLDATFDLYDTAFVLFAAGWLYKATAAPQALDVARRTLDAIEAKLAHPAGGFWHAWPAEGHRQQNPHMHLLEAALVWVSTGAEPRFDTLARRLIDLFRTKFCDPRTGVLREFFDDALVPAAGEAGRIVEPGHQLEWAWILGEARRLLDVDTSALAAALVAFAERHGVDPVSGVVYNSVRDDGAALDRGSRTWPNTERLKGAIAAYELTGADPRTALAGSLGILLDRYLATTRPGLWIDAFDAEAKPTAKTVPASTLYHVFLAFAEVLRVAPRLL